jgi:iron(III) transport system substrate-binding protein
MANAPNPNAARLFHAWSMTGEAQQLISTLQACAPPIRRPRTSRPRRSSPTSSCCGKRRNVVADKADEIKVQYVKYFKV